MLCYLKLKNYLLVPEVELNFNEGFICFTGETGAGKSMILGSIELLKGERIDWNLFQNKEEIVIEGMFKVELDEELIKKYELEEADSLYIQRVLNPLNKISKIRINGIPVTSSVLKEIVEKFIEVHGQHSQLFLLSKENQLDIIDSYADLKEEVESFKKLYSEYLKLKKELDELSKDYERILSMKEFMENSIKEFEEINIKEINFESLFDEYRKLYSKKELKNKINEVIYELSEGENSIEDKLKKILRECEDLKDVIKRPVELLLQILELLNELTEEMVRFRFEEEEDERRLNELEGILEKIEILKRKHRTDEKGLLLLYDKWKSELEGFEFLQNKIKNLEKILKEKEKEINKRAEVLSKKRKDASYRFCKEVEDILLNLGFSYIKFLIEFKERNIYEKGKDDVNFLISTSKERVPYLISKVASGGELSRIMLAIKSLISEKDKKNILIFDEIDVGIGGQVARIVGFNLKKLSKKRQVFCITHLPQIASFADQHFHVFKETDNGKVLVKVKELKDVKEREKEIARMIAGEKIDESSLNAARKLLEESLKK